ncbi:MAG: DEAD/DEAH box helicase family protein [Thermomicrobiales bacterium]|nr:DEAD/DEAH box helicase family protein [Thermomicrobiales bacterium]
MANLEFVAIDVEATGLDPARSEIIEVAAVAFSARMNEAPYQTLIRPFGGIPIEIERLTGIRNEDVASAPLLRDVEPMLQRQLGRRIVVGHVIEQDVAYLESGGIPVSNRTLDTLALSRLLLPGLPSYSLENLGVALGLTVDGDAHRAASDALLTVRLMQALLQRIARIDPDTRARVAGLLSTAEPEIATLFLDPAIDDAFPDLLYDPSPDFRFLAPRQRPESLKPVGKRVDIEEERVRSLFEANGALAEAVPGFQHRDGQARMAGAVARAINGDETLVVEAGTGTGKSLAYLVPAAMYAIENGRRVVVSTNTIALQDQLLSKDVPSVRRALTVAGVEQPLSASVVKGRGNYLCLKRWFNHQRTMPLGPADASMRGRATIWLSTTETGDRAELNLTQDEESEFRAVSAEGEACNAARCPFNHRNQCFLYRARRDAEASHLLIVNHALLLSDVLAENALLPDSDVLVIDEAHHLEDQATNQFGFNVSDPSINAAIDGIIRHEGPVTVGALSTGADLLVREWRNAGGADTSRADKLIERMRDALEHAAGARRAAGDLFGLVQALLDARPAVERSIRLTADVRDGANWASFELATDALAAQLINLDRDAKWVLDQIGQLPSVAEDSPAADERADVVLELENAQRELADQRFNLHEIVLSPSDEGIYWLERGFAGRVSLHAAPLHVGELLQAQLFERLESVILTSATLTTDNSFGYVKERLGLHDTRDLAMQAPFDYRSQAMLFVADDMPEPNQPGYQAALNEAIVDLSRGVGGRTLVLFTSHAALQTTYHAIKPILERHGIAVLAQRIDGSPRRLIERMRMGGPLVVLGAATFWEGVDIAGPALSAIAIVRLPFAVPTDPVIAARSELFDNPFMEYSTPQAILKFKQGFGRLIRRQDDIGVCAVLDRRVVSKRYGRSFLESLPNCTLTYGSRHTLGDVASDWIEQALDSTIDGS